MAKGIYNKRKGISFITSMTIYVTLILFQDMFTPTINSSILRPKTAFLVGVYILIGLTSRDYKQLGMLIERIWALNSTQTNDPSLKLKTIRAYIAMNVTQWDKLWRLYQEIVDGKENQWTWKERLKEHLMRIPKGHLSIIQFLWILSYIMFNVIEDNYFLLIFPAAFINDFNFIIDIISLGFFSYTSGIVIGLNKFMSNIFETIKPINEAQVKQSLDMLEQHIIYGSRHYGFLRDIMDIKDNIPPSYNPPLESERILSL